MHFHSVSVLAQSAGRPANRSVRKQSERPAAGAACYLVSQGVLVILSARLVLEKNRAAKRRFPSETYQRKCNRSSKHRGAFCGNSGVDGLFCHVEKQGAVRAAYPIAALCESQAPFSNRNVASGRCSPGRSTCCLITCPMSATPEEVASMDPCPPSATVTGAPYLAKSCRGHQVRSKKNRHQH